MTFAFQFYDSEVGKVTLTNQRLEIEFSAANVRLLKEKSSGYALGLMVVMHGAEISEVDRNWIGRIRDGVLIVDGNRKRELELPFQLERSCSVELDFYNGTNLRCSATSFRVIGDNESRFLESFMC